MVLLKRDTPEDQQRHWAVRTEDHLQVRVPTFGPLHVNLSLVHRDVPLRPLHGDAQNSIVSNSESRVCYDEGVP